MLKYRDPLLWVLLVIVLSRLLSMVFLPMSDTTEPRYAEIARIMAETGDWITPWFDYGLPFWGKPPLSFWLEALSFKLLGITEFSARLPSWLVTIGVLALIYRLTRELAGVRQGLLAAIIFASMVLSYALSGAVLTDPFLAFGTTLSFVSVILAAEHPGSAWRWWFFVGAAIGLLAKGPLTLILIGGPMVLLLAWTRDTRYFRALPWWRGMILMLTLSLPWYIAAELKTPGFTDYFLVGEHFLRFVAPGWNGDLYGTAHQKPWGTIWIYFIIATFPWGILAIVYFLWTLLFTRNKKTILPRHLSDAQRLLILATLFPSLFFTFSGNILATYQLPALAPLSIVIATLIDNDCLKSRSRYLGALGLSLLVPLALTGASIYGYINPNVLKTEKGLVSYYNSHDEENAYPLYYIGKAPFSARFYSQGQVVDATFPNTSSINTSPNIIANVIAVPNSDRDQYPLPPSATALYSNKRYTLYRVDGIHLAPLGKTRLERRFDRLQPTNSHDR